MAGNFNHLVFAAGYIFCLLSGLLRIGLGGAFVIGILRWNFSPWWAWPIAVAVAVVLSRAGKLLMATSRKGDATERKLMGRPRQPSIRFPRVDVALRKMIPCHSIWLTLITVVSHILHRAISLLPNLVLGAVIFILFFIFRVGGQSFRPSNGPASEGTSRRSIAARTTNAHSGL